MAWRANFEISFSVFAWQLERRMYDTPFEQLKTEFFNEDKRKDFIAYRIGKLLPADNTKYALF